MSDSCWVRLQVLSFSQNDLKLLHLRRVCCGALTTETGTPLLMNSFVASNSPADSREKEADAVLFFIGGDASWFAGVRSV
ncbi:hypothetical protein EYF80_055677 [Liparis tanakae]|uniref:Uncharacterized protein n=1 Tax=Liparis tanakae TaxID=230148 RepID=A0A4Z2EZ77_9TELE|nr:hypothetical protein EYF80_055677 [Liparis tanakae]